MTYSDQTYNLRIDLDTKECQLSQKELERIERTIAPLRKPLEKFPISVLYLTIAFHDNSNQYRVKSALQLSGRTLATGDVDEVVYPAVRRSVRKLVHKVLAYEHDLDDAEERSKHLKGTRHDVVPGRDINSDAVDRAVGEGDYVAFRKELFPYEEPLRKRIGRWIERYPEAEAELSGRLSLADMVEEVYMTAFEEFENRPRNVSLGDWLENLIDPAVKLLVHSPDEQLANISFVRSWWDSDGQSANL